MTDDANDHFVAKFRSLVNKNCRYEDFTIERLMQLYTACWVRLAAEHTEYSKSDQEIDNLHDFVMRHRINFRWFDSLKISRKIFYLQLVVTLLFVNDVSPHDLIEETRSLLVSARQGNDDNNDGSDEIALHTSSCQELLAPIVTTTSTHVVRTSTIAQIDPEASLPMSSARDDDDDDGADDDSTLASTKRRKTNRTTIGDLSSDDATECAAANGQRTTDSRTSTAGGVTNGPSEAVKFMQIAKKSVEKKPYIATGKQEKVTDERQRKKVSRPKTRIDMSVTSEDTPVTCECGKKFPNLTAYRIHVQHEHRGRYSNAVHICQHLCKFFSVREDFMRMHCQNVHGESARFAACPVGCTELSGATQTANVQRDITRRMFVNKPTFTSHMTAWHQWDVERIKREAARQKEMSAAQFKEFITIHAPALVEVQTSVITNDSAEVVDETRTNTC